MLEEWIEKERLSVVEKKIGRDQTDWDLNSGLCYLGDHLAPQFPHLENESNNSTYLMALVWEVIEIKMYEEV